MTWWGKLRDRRCLCSLMPQRADLTSSIWNEGIRGRVGFAECVVGDIQLYVSGDCEADFCLPANQPGFPVQVRLNPRRKPRNYIKGSRWMEYFNIPFLIFGWMANSIRCTAENAYLYPYSCTLFSCQYISKTPVNAEDRGWSCMCNDTQHVIAAWLCFCLANV